MPSATTNAAQPARAGAKVEHVVGVANSVFVVLHNQNGVAQVAQPHERFNQPVVVALMQTDGWLIEHIENAAQARSNLRSQADALSFAAGERCRIAIEREIGEAHRAEEFEPLDHFAPDSLGHQRFAFSEFQIDGCGERAIQRQGSEVRNRKASDFYCQRLWPQALAATYRAGSGRHETHHVFAIAFAARLFNAVAQIGKNAVKACARPLALGRAVDEDVLLLWRQVFKRLA